MGMPSSRTSVLPAETLGQTPKAVPKLGAIICPPISPQTVISVKLWMAVNGRSGGMKVFVLAFNEWSQQCSKYMPGTLHAEREKETLP